MEGTEKRRMASPWPERNGNPITPYPADRSPAPPGSSAPSASSASTFGGLIVTR